MFEEAAVALFDRPEFFKEAGELLHLIILEDKESVDVLLLFPVVGKAVVAALNPEMLWHEITTDLERGDAGGVGLQGQCHEFVDERKIFHEIDVFRLVDGSFRFGDFDPLLFELELLLDFADGV